MIPPPQLCGTRHSILEPEEAFNWRQREVVIRAIEFGKREPNRIISTYCEIYGVDEERVRAALIRKGEDKLEQLIPYAKPERPRGAGRVK